MKQFLIIFYTLFVFIFATLLTFLLLLPSIIYILLPVRYSMGLAGRHWQIFTWILFRFLMGTKILKIDQRSQKYCKRLMGPGLIICNHMSFWDIPLYLHYFSCAPIMKKEILKVPIIGLIALANGSIPLNRNSPHSRKLVVDAVKKRLNDGVPVQFYPESTRNKDWKLGPKPYDQIKKTLLLLAFEMKVPVIPVTFYGTPHLMNKNGLLNWGEHLGIYIGKEVIPSDFTDEESFSHFCWQQVIEGHNVLENKLQKLS
ncbi:MAG: lysophospholipid acyltransferase family protein [Bacteriovoracaceae bacterium]|nr:lysophospholipid acyltransferase family protein [Bacteriovoracaceae bacterium]